MNIGDYIIDSDGHCCLVVNKITTNACVAVEVYHLRKTDSGINCTNWYLVDRSFNERFKMGLNGYLQWLDRANYNQIKTYFRTKELLKNR